MSRYLRHRLKLALRGESYATELLSMLFGTTGSVFYVHSGTGSSSWDGSSPERPCATLAQAVALCTANKGDLILLMPGHNENIGNAQITLNVAGITVVGLGRGSDAPRFDFDHANASIDVTANGIALKNIRLLPSVTAVAIGIDVNAAVTDTLLEDIFVLPGEDGAGVDEFALGVDLKAGCDRTVIRGMKYTQHASAAGIVAAISLTGASDNVLIENCDIKCVGAGVTAPIQGNTTLSTNVRIRNCYLETDAEPGIELLTGTTGFIEFNRIFTDLATKAAAIVADGCGLSENYYTEVATETGGIIGTASADD